ncbi:hypothetical protein CVT26_006339 [Gymnopilus dilepis]|uniref:Uncharacterized protein n=1 Tax=Gymnopilus dilepis TaxID=231916 RepID=A0A409Y0L9_9AGAR|nr:hypothetical protein CVT26_006339 [Gymnopilus dilepis]
MPSRADVCGAVAGACSRTPTASSARIKQITNIHEDPSIHVTAHLRSRFEVSVCYWLPEDTSAWQHFLHHDIASALPASSRPSPEFQHDPSHHPSNSYYDQRPLDTSTFVSEDYQLRELSACVMLVVQVLPARAVDEQTTKISRACFSSAASTTAFSTAPVCPDRFGPPSEYNCEDLKDASAMFCRLRGSFDCCIVEKKVAPPSPSSSTPHGLPRKKVAGLVVMEELEEEEKVEKAVEVGEEKKNVVPSVAEARALPPSQSLLALSCS